MHLRRSPQQGKKRQALRLAVKRPRHAEACGPHGRMEGGPSGSDALPDDYFEPLLLEPVPPVPLVPLEPLLLMPLVPLDPLLPAAPVVSRFWQPARPTTNRLADNNAARVLLSLVMFISFNRWLWMSGKRCSTLSALDIARLPIRTMLGNGVHRMQHFRCGI
jgi:hypothetical protein